MTDYDKLMDRYRDKLHFSVYYCRTCGFRGFGAAVTLHPLSHGVMIREIRRKWNESKGEKNPTEM